MIAYRLIQKKRDGEELTPDELEAFFGAYADDRLPDYQMAAFLMAVYFRGLSPRELAALVDVMMGSGAVVRLDDVPGIKVDKHSTGGVGDKVSLILAPLVASLGVPVPMMSGRGLGHTGGTLDKLESIPGFRTDLSLTEFRDQLGRLGCAMIGQTAEIVPLDRKLYALRDVTGTVESIPLIASSIMSKKLAEGIDALVLDVKRGAGAFIPELDRALELARLMIAIGAARDREVVALVTAMDRPLGHAIGNALEVEESIATLQGGGPPDLRVVTVALAGEMLALAGAAPDPAAGRRAAEAALDDGRALDTMARLIEAQGGNPSVVEDPALLPQASMRRVVEATADGVVHAIDVRAIGWAAVELGAGRTRLGAAIDHGVGFHVTAEPGDAVRRGEAIATVYARSEADARRGAATLAAAIHVASEPAADVLPLISHRVTRAGIEEWTATTG